MYKREGGKCWVSFPCVRVVFDFFLPFFLFIKKKKKKNTANCLKERLVVFFCCRFFLKFFMKCNQNCLKNAGNPRDMRRFQVCSDLLHVCVCVLVCLSGFVSACLLDGYQRLALWYPTATLHQYCLYFKMSVQVCLENHHGDIWAPTNEKLQSKIWNM